MKHLRVKRSVFYFDKSFTIIRIIIIIIVYKLPTAGRSPTRVKKALIVAELLTPRMPKIVTFHRRKQRVLRCFKHIT